MNVKIQQQLRKGKRRIKRRLEKTQSIEACPVISAANIHYEIAERTRAISAGGIGLIYQMVRRLEFDKAINRSIHALKLYLPYSESDHVLNIAYNILADGTCLEHLEYRRNDEAYLDALGAQRIPDPTTADDFCRRFDSQMIIQLMETTHLDRWDDDQVEFVFGIDARENLYELAEALPASAWKRLNRPEREVKTTPRARPENVKQQIVEERKFKDIYLAGEYVAEFAYQPVACDREYRVVVVWKDLEVFQGQAKLFDNAKCFFYISNDREMTAEEVVFDANDRCNQENLIEQQKNGVHALTAPLGDLDSNWAYMVMASLAWSLKAWSALLLPVSPRWRERHTREKRRLLRMDFATYRQAFINVPAQIVRTGRKIIYRLLAWNPWQGAFFRLLARLKTIEHW